MKKVNVLWLWYRADLIGGVESLLRGMAKRIDRSKFSVTLGVFQVGPVASLFEVEGVRVVEIPRSGKFDIRVIHRLMSVVKEFGIDVIHTHGHLPGIAGRIVAKLTGRRVISTYHNALHEDGHPGTTRAITKLTLSLADHVTFVSRRVEESYYGTSVCFSGMTIPSGRHCTIFNGTDLEVISRAASPRDKSVVRSLFGLGDEEILLVAAGRLSEEKGHRYLIKAMGRVVRQYANVRLLIFGEGELHDDYERLIRDEGVSEHVRLVPPTDQILSVLAAADLFVLPSLREGLPMILLESMGIGNVVVATSVTGITEVIVHGKNGILVPPRNPTALSEAIIKTISMLQEDGEEAASLARNARSTVAERFDIKLMVRQYEQLYLPRQHADG